MYSFCFLIFWLDSSFWTKFDLLFSLLATLFYCSDPRGFGFVQYVDPADAADAKYQMDGTILQGRELTVVFAEENRKKPTEMRARERGRLVSLFIYVIINCVDTSSILLLGYKKSCVLHLLIVF